MIKLWLDRQWINQISGSLPKFRWTNKNTANFRCIACGDSEKNPRKRRGYLFIHKDAFIYKCHNCGLSTSFENILKEYFPEVYPEYRLELFKEMRSTEPVKAVQQPKKVSRRTPSDRLKKRVRKAHRVSALYSDHPAKIYCRNRKIPEPQFKHIYYTDNFSEFVDTNFDEDYEQLPEDERIVFLLKENDGTLLGAQGRRLDAGGMRYITIKRHDSPHKLFGLERLDTNLPIFVVEGPVDSLFLPNAVALCGGDVSESLSILPKENVYVCLDNEPRSKDTIARMKIAIDSGYRVVMWDFSSEYKDINDMVLGGISRKEILKTIKNQSVNGLKAKAKLTHWKQI